MSSASFYLSIHRWAGHIISQTKKSPAFPSLFLSSSAFFLSFSLSLSLHQQIKVDSIRGEKTFLCVSSVGCRKKIPFIEFISFFFSHGAGKVLFRLLLSESACFRHRDKKRMGSIFFFFFALRLSTSGGNLQNDADEYKFSIHGLVATNLR